MTTIEMHHARKGAFGFGNGLLARGFARGLNRQANQPEKVMGSWSCGSGCGVSGMATQGEWTHEQAVVAGGVR